jgi:hypothetical protein
MKTKTAKTGNPPPSKQGRVMRVCCCTSLKFFREKKQSRNETTNSNAEKEKENWKKPTQPNRPRCAEIMK